MIQSSNYADVKKRIELKDFIIKGKNNFNLIWFNSYYRLCYVEGILTREEYLIERSLNISFFNNLSRFLTLDRSRMINFSVTRGYREYPKCKKSWRGREKGNLIYHKYLDDVSRISGETYSFGIRFEAAISCPLRFPINPAKTTSPVQVSIPL